MYLDGTSAPLCEGTIITVTRYTVPVHFYVDFLGVADTSDKDACFGWLPLAEGLPEKSKK